VILAPVEIVFSFVSGYLSQAKPFAFGYKMHIICSLLSTYTILILFGLFPKEKEDIESTWTIVHVCGLSLLSTLAHSCLDTGSFSVIFQICDKRIAGVYITLLATIQNLSSYVHKLYLFTLVEYLGLFWTQGLISAIALIFAFIVRKRMIQMDEFSKESWGVSDKVLHKITGNTTIDKKDD
jgi:hypothetical protein